MTANGDSFLSWPKVTVTREQAESVGCIWLDGWMCDADGCSNEATHMLVGVGEDEPDEYYCPTHNGSSTSAGEIVGEG